LPPCLPIAASPASGPGRGTLVIGSRFCNGNGQDIPAYRKIGMRILDITTNFLGGLCVTDTQSGFRAFSGQTKGAALWTDYAEEG